MSVKVGRNDNCPCGSGKKYKKCCEKNEVVSIHTLLESEMDELQKNIYTYSIKQYHEVLDLDFQEISKELEIVDEEEKDFLKFIHIGYFTLFHPQAEGETILETYLHNESKKIKRPKLQQILQTWTNAKIVCGRILEIQDQNVMYEDLFTKERSEVVNTNEPVSMDVGSFMLGMVLPYEEKWMYFVSPFILSDTNPEDVLQLLESEAAASDYETPQLYFKENFIKVMNKLPKIEPSVNVEHLQWPAPVYEEVANMFQLEMEKTEEHEYLSRKGINLWNKYCLRKQKRINNPSIYAAAMHYFMINYFPSTGEVTQKALAEQYGVSASSISNAVYDLEEVLDDELKELYDMLDIEYGDE